MRMIAPALALALLVPQLIADPYPTDRDRIISEADTFYNLDWYCSATNIYTGIAGCLCDYVNPDDIGWQRSMSYQWGGEDTVDVFLGRIAAGAGAGDVDTSYSDNTGAVTGVDCSGYVSCIWESGRYATASFANASFYIDREDLRMGDALNYAGSHIRLFVRWEDADHLWIYESTVGGVPSGPARVIQRSILWDSNYLPIRYDLDSDATNFVRIDPEPTILWAVENGTGNVWIPFDGEADTGFQLQHSTDGSAWVTVQDETTLDSASYRADLTGVAAGTDHFYRMRSVNSSSSTDWSDTLAFRTPPTGASRILIVDGIDRWRTQDGGDNPGHTFLVPVAQSLGRLGFGYDSCSNEMVAADQIDLTTYDVVIWLLAEEGTFDEAVSRGEQYHIQEYLEGGGNLFISGSEICWDLDHQSTNSSAPRFWDVTDESFMLDYLKVDFASDGTAGNGHQANGVTSTPMEGLTFNFDDGTHGTYDVMYPDSFTPQTGAEAWLTYQTGGENAMVAYEGLFNTGLTPGRIVILGFGLETVYSTTECDALLGAVLDYFNASVPVEMSVFGVR